MTDEQKPHECKSPDDTKGGMWGHAITDCWEKDGLLWVGNDEYENTVKFCPFCGFTLEGKDNDRPNQNEPS